MASFDDQIPRYPYLDPSGKIPFVYLIYVIIFTLFRRLSITVSGLLSANFWYKVPFAYRNSEYSWVGDRQRVRSNIVKTGLK